MSVRIFNECDHNSLCTVIIFADGTLHHIGEGLRRMSHAHLHHESDHTHNGGTRRKSVPNVDLDEQGNPTHSDNQFKRVSSAPLLDSSDIVGVDTVLSPKFRAP